MTLVFAFLFHTVGAFCASVCYTPQKKVDGWSWQTFWMTQAFFCWFLFPVLGAWLTIPHLWQVLQEAPTRVMLMTFLMGMAYGIGGTAFGVAIRHIGYSLTYAIAVGLSAVLGTLVPPMVHGTLGALMNQSGARWIFLGIFLGILGITGCGVAGRMREKRTQQNAKPSEFHAATGLLLALLAGILSAVYGLAMDLGKPISQIAERFGAGHFSGNVIYIFANTGALVSTSIYCLYLHRKEKTFREFVELPVAHSPRAWRLPLNFTMAILTGALWYGQFFFYTLGHARMTGYEFVSWALHMILLVLLSNLVGVLFREWKGSGNRVQLTITGGLALLILAILCLSYGSFLG